jgi:hypothetical protein
MPVEAKPLFRPDVLRSHLSGFSLPSVDAAKLEHWADLIATGRLDTFGEQEILRDFLACFFVELLGYTRPAGHDRYTIGWERRVEVDGKFADAVLGDFNGDQRYTVVVEGKGPRDPLERPFAGRHRSAVDQGYLYCRAPRCPSPAPLEARSVSEGRLPRVARLEFLRRAWRSTSTFRGGA